MVLHFCRVVSSPYHAVTVVAARSEVVDIMRQVFPTLALFDTDKKTHTLLFSESLDHNVNMLYVPGKIQHTQDTPLFIEAVCVLAFRVILPTAECTEHSWEFDTVKLIELLNLMFMSKYLMFAKQELLRGLILRS